MAVLDDILILIRFILEEIAHYIRRWRRNEDGRPPSLTAGRESSHSEDHESSTINEELQRKTDKELKEKPRKKIEPNETQFRIKNKKDGRYLTITKRYGMPAAKLTHSNQCHFFITERDSRGIRISIRDPMDSVHKYMYEFAFFGWIFFGKDASYDRNQYWHVTNMKRSSEVDQYDGDIVSLRNHKHGSHYLCHYGETKTTVDIYSIKHREDEWLLEVV